MPFVITSKVVKRPKFNSFTNHYKSRLYAYLISNLPKMTDKGSTLIKQAYLMAYKAHYNVCRRGGTKEAYISHPVEVAIIIAKEMGFGPTSIAAALLHDVVEDNSDYTFGIIEETFGKDIALIVSGVTKITDHGDKRYSKNFDDTSAQKMYFIYMLKLIPDDFRVLLIKVADRLHNMRTMDDMPENNRRIKSSENLYIYARLAGMAGLWNIKKELEDRSFKYLFPNAYYELSDIKKEYDKFFEQKNKKFHKKLQSILASDYDYEICTAKRSLFKVWQEIRENRIEFKKIYNYLATRIIIDVNNKDKKKEQIVKRKVAYDIYLQITNHFPEKGNSLKDWILHPRSNGFCALIFTAMVNGEWKEIQIISRKDNTIADKGWVNKDNAPGLNNLQSQIRDDLNEIIEKLDEKSKNEEILQFFTPQGDIIELPEGSTVLDFAFKIHTKLGLHCFGATIDNKDIKVSRNYKLNRNEVVNIVTDESIVPNLKWFEQCFTTKAKNTIKNYLKKENKITEKQLPTATNKQRLIFSRKQPFIIDGTIKYRQASCCKPVPYDKAMVYRRKNDTLMIHHENCSKALALRANDAENTTTVVWKIKETTVFYPTTIEIEGIDKIGILKEIINVITEKLEVNISKFKIENQDNLFYGRIELLVKDNSTIKNVIDKLKLLSGIRSVFRKFN